jgi:hypothetical protein
VQSRWTVSYNYLLSRQAWSKAILVDKQGISKRFLSYFTTLDKTAGSRAVGPDQTLSGKVQSTLSNAAAQARSVDEQKGYSKVAHDVSIILLPSQYLTAAHKLRTKQYYSKAVASPFGQQVFSFYTTTSKQILDIHAEARRIADQHKAPGTAPATTSPASAAAPAAETEAKA